MSLFLGKNLSFVLVLAIAGFIALDVNKRGSFKGSKTGVFFRDCGALEYGEQALTRFKAYSQQAYRWSQRHMGEFVKIVGEVAIALRNVLTTLFLEFWTNIQHLYQYFVDQKPLVVQWINQYAPGLVDKVSAWFTQSWALLTEYTLQLYAVLLQYLTLVVNWLRDNVFVGKLSPENLQRYTMEALNTTRMLAKQTLSWLNGRIVTITSTA